MSAGVHVVPQSVALPPYVSIAAGGQPSVAGAQVSEVRSRGNASFEDRHIKVGRVAGTGDGLLEDLHGNAVDRGSGRNGEAEIRSLQLIRSRRWRRERHWQIRRRSL